MFLNGISCNVPNNTPMQFRYRLDSENYMKTLKATFPIVIS